MSCAKSTAVLPASPAAAYVGKAAPGIKERHTDDDRRILDRLLRGVPVVEPRRHQKSGLSINFRLSEIDNDKSQSRNEDWQPVSEPGQSEHGVVVPGRAGVVSGSRRGRKDTRTSASLPSQTRLARRQLVWMSCLRGRWRQRTRARARREVKRGSGRRCGTVSLRRGKGRRSTGS